MRVALPLTLFALAVPAAGSLVTINFDSAPASIPLNFYSGQGLMTLALTNGNQGPFGGGMLVSAVPPPGAPLPASGLGITPYANLAGFMSPFEMTFSQSIDYFSLWAFDGPQAFTVQAFRFGSPVAALNVPAAPGRTAIELQFGAVGGALRIDRVLVIPVVGIGGSDPDRGPKYYDELTFNTVPAPAGASLLVGLCAFRRRR